MDRPILEPAKIHPAIRDQIASYHRDLVDEVQTAVAAHPIVIVGMKQNPFPKRARKALKDHGTPFHYLEYGSYLGPYRRRLALKMWTGWSTLPMIFIKGTLIGGAAELEAMIASGELDKLLAA